MKASRVTEDQFAAWMKKVDGRIEELCGLSHRDLADQWLRHWFEAGVTPREAARRTLADEGFKG